MSGAAVFKRLPLAAKGVQVYQVSSATYRAGAALGMDLSVTKKPLNQALDAAIHKPQFLEVDTLKGDNISIVECQPTTSNSTPSYTMNGQSYCLVHV
ncbi:hypothetical protein FOZ62_007200 [Perkinsus olseni]|uniref:Uncharacterized protein n=1 Tax=Perkinsus olseni TaxID=32597 RepID=A0A7J6R5Z7_PEROL|nr:hypothetical protein FOZ62_007200 [Perkinsus olseni]